MSAPSLTWKELLLSRDDALAQRLTSLDGIAALMPRLAPPMHPADALGGAVRTVAEALLLFGPARCESHLASLVPLLEPALQGMEPSEPGRVPTTQGLLSFVLIAQSTGALASARHSAQVRAWLAALVERQPPLDPQARGQCGVLAAAFGDDASARSLLGGAPAAFAPNRTFADTLHLCGYLLDGAAVQAPFTTVESAWQSYLSYFPTLLESRQTNWVALHALGRIVLQRFAHVPIMQLASRLHQQVMLAIAAG